MSDGGDMLSASAINSSSANESSVNGAGQISMETLYQAIQILYSEVESIPAADKHRANEVLEQFQKSVQAWSLADQLLYQGPDLRTRYFGAHTLRMKIQSSFHELPSDSYSALRDSLVQHVKNVTDRSEVSITNQLCLAVTYLVLQATNWADPIGQLLNSFGPNPKCWWPLLEILIYIPEEAYSRKLHLGENRRNQVLSQLASVAHTVLDFLKKCLQSYTSGALADADINTDMLTASILNCFKAWVQVNAEVFCTDQPGEILGFAMTQLHTGRCSTNVHEAATDAVIEVLYHLPDPDKTDNNNVIDMHGLQQALFQSIMACEEAYHLSVAEEDLEKTLNYCRLFTDYAESVVPFMAKSPTNPHYSLRAIDLVLICEGHHDYEVAENTFQFWYKLTDVVYHLHDEPLNAMFRPYAQRCIQAMYKHCYIEADHEGPLPKDDDFYEFRTRVAELVEDLAFMIGDLQIFQDIGQQLVSPTATWYSLEAALFLLRPLAKSVNMRDVAIIEPIIRAVLSLTDWKHICVRISAVKFIGAMSMWFRRHSGEGSEYLLRAMAFLANSLEFPEVSNPAGAALLSMCQNCSEQIAPNLDSLLGLLEQMDRFNVSNDAVVGLLRGLGHIMNTLPRDKLQTVLKQICYAQLVNLDALPLHHPDAEERGSKNDPIFWVDRLSALFRTTDIDLKEGEEHPCKNVICEDVWPVMSRVCERFQADPRIMERVCRCLRYAVRCVGKHSHPFLQPLVTQLVQMYAAHHHSCFLYMGSILVDEYGSLHVCVPGLIQMLEAFYLPTFQLLQDATGLRNHPDTVDDFFRLCVRYIQHCPVPFLGSQVFNNIVQLGLHGINLDHSEAHMSVMKFFYELVHQCRKEDTDAALAGMVKNILRQYGLNSVFTCLHAAIFNLPGSLLIGICDLFYQLKAYMQNDLSAWLEAALKQLPNKTVSGAPYATLAQLEEFHKHMMDSRSAKEMRRRLQEFCRLYR